MQKTACLLCLIFLCWAGPLFALDVPPLRGRINDYAGLLSPSTVSQLEETLGNFEASESTQIVVLTIPSLEGQSVEAFSLQVAETWGIGQKGRDNGALLFISKNDRALRIEVGYGLEGKLTDLVSGRIIRNTITPRFKEGNFDQGIRDGVQAIIAAVQGEFTAQEPVKSRSSSSFDPGSGIFFLLVFFSILGRIFTKHPMLAAITGALILPAFGAIALRLWGIWLPVLAMLGFIGGLVAAYNSGSSHRGRSRNNSISMGSWGSGSSSGFGGSSGGGGFSGGGGGFGGGGASGSW